MKSCNDKHRIRSGTAALALGIALAVSGCGAFDGGRSVAQLPAASKQAGADRTGPAADYPVTIGDPYTVDGTLYTPVDTLNYDEVGYATVESGGGQGITAAHHTLPIPSYVEVTSLDSGRTILVRLERRGPMTGTSLIALSPEAAGQLGVAAGAPVRVRRVNPPEVERAALRQGERAPERLETPETLLSVLRRKLPAGGGAATLAQAAPPDPPARAVVQAPSAAKPRAVVQAPSAAKPSRPASPLALPPLAESATAAPAPAPAPARQTVRRTAPPPAPAADGAYVVQAGAYSTSDRAQRVANVIGGSVSRVGSLYRVRTGPFATRSQAEASLAKVRAAGYSGARIFTNG